MFTSKYKIAAVSLSSILVLLAFQNCSPQKFVQETGGTQESASSAETSEPLTVITPTTSTPIVVSVGATENQLVTTTGKTLSFVNIRNQSVGQVQVTKLNETTILASLYTPSTGRSAQVIVNINPATGDFTSVQRYGSKSYMCYGETYDVCQNYGSKGYNCSSPIFYRGSINGSLDNLKEPADAYYCGVQYSASDRATWIQ